MNHTPEPCNCWVCRESVKLEACQRCGVPCNPLDCQRHDLAGWFGRRWCTTDYVVAHAEQPR